MQRKKIYTSYVLTFLLLVSSLVSFSLPLQAQLTPESLFDSSPTFLKVDEAFGFDYEQKDGQLIIKWDIEPEYYLYKKQFKVVTKNASIAEPNYPLHEQIEDEFFGLSDVFFNDMEVVYPIIEAAQDSSVKIRFQGCATAGLCYPPTTKVVFLDAYSSGSKTPEQAIKVVPAYDQQAQKLNFTIELADDYVLLVDSLSVDSIAYELGDVTITSDSFQAQILGKNHIVYRGEPRLEYQILSFDKETPAAPTVDLQFQVCHRDGMCFMPSEYSINTQDLSQNSQTHSEQNETSSVSAQYTLADKLLNGNIFLGLAALFVLGIGLAFTPCVYPMYPILSSIVIGKGKKEIKASQAFALSFTYVQGMAITYSILGLIVASAGVQFQAALQHPVLLSIFIVLFILLALAMFGLYEIQLPNKWQNKLNSLSDGQKQGNFVGVFIMGVVSGLVASPCTTAPLTAVLVVVAQSDSLVFGFSALYALSLGMGIPLILFGITGGKLLPKAGSWMNVIKTTFGFMMLTVAILFVERFVISEWTNLLWAALGLSLFAYWYTVNQNTATSFFKGVRTLVSISGLVIIILFSVQSLQKLDLIPTIIQSTQSEEKGHPEFMVVKDLNDFNNKLSQANQDGKTVMIDLYADWCVACKEFEKYTFPDPKVVDALSDAVWMQIDLTDNTPSNLEFQEHFNILGLPTIMFFNTKGEELKRSRVTGFMQADAFAEHAKNTSPKN